MLLCLHVAYNLCTAADMYGVCCEQFSNIIIFSRFSILEYDHSTDFYIKIYSATRRSRTGMRPAGSPREPFIPHYVIYEAVEAVSNGLPPLGRGPRCKDKVLRR